MGDAEYKFTICPVEVGRRDFALQAHSTIRFLKDVGIQGQSQCQAIKALSGAAERAIQGLWIRGLEWRGHTWDNVNVTHCLAHWRIGSQTFPAE